LGRRVCPHVQPGHPTNGPLTFDVGVVQKLLVEKEVSCLPVVLCDDDAPDASCFTLGQRSSSKLMPKLLGLLSPSDVLREHAFYRAG
jgi:hypothetical protein